MKSCETGGDYCTFHKKILAIIEDIEAQEWFPVYQEVHKTEEWIWNDEIFDNEVITTFKDHLDFEFLIDIIYDEVQKIENNIRKGSNTDNSRIDLIVAALETVDYESIFYESEDYHKYVRKEEEKAMMESMGYGDNGDNGDYGEYGEGLEEERKKRQIEQDGEEEVEEADRDGGEEEGSGKGSAEESEESSGEEDKTGDGEGSAIGAEEGEKEGSKEGEQENGVKDGGKDEGKGEDIGQEGGADIEKERGEDAAKHEGEVVGEEGIQNVGNNTDTKDAGVREDGSGQNPEVTSDSTVNENETKEVESGAEVSEKGEVGSGAKVNNEGEIWSGVEVSEESEVGREAKVSEYGEEETGEEKLGGGDDDGDGEDSGGGGEDVGVSEEGGGQEVVGGGQENDGGENGGNRGGGEEVDVGGHGESSGREESEEGQKQGVGEGPQQAGGEGPQQGGGEGHQQGGGEGNEEEENVRTESITSVLARGKKFVSFFLSLLEKIESRSINATRKKRQVIKDKKINCHMIERIPHLIGEMRDGAVFSVAKMKRIQLLQSDKIEEIENLRKAGLENCGNSLMVNVALARVKPAVEQLDYFLKVKDYDDGIEYSSDNHCELPEWESSECTCECSKKKKLSIYGIFGSLTMLDKQDFKLGGDVLNWYYNGVMDRDTLGASTRLHVSKDIAEEMINFDRNVLKDISKKDIQLGLRDYITNMAQPASIWKTAFEFPRLNSWNIEAKKEMFKLFNYHESMPFRGVMELSMPDFETFSVGSICKDPEVLNLTNYCKMVESLPDFETTMELMHLAKYPLEFKDDIKESLASFTKSENPIPKLSYIPTCFFGDNAAKFWSLKEYSETDFISDISQEKFESNHRESLNLPDSDIYKYPKCRQFAQKPTDDGICHTFNGLDLKNILKSSSWLSSFEKSFGGKQEEKKPEDILKSEGIDKEGGFVFSLDTMQSYLITKRKRNYKTQGYFNSFWMKVHKPGDLPRMKDDKSSWTKVVGSQHDMVTKFISLKGERVSHKKSFRELKSDTRKCKFPDEGHSELFEYYTESNCKLDCAWKKAEEICGCKPWFVPAENGTETCFVLGNVCFQEIMEKVSSGKINTTCDCQQDCVYSRYTIDVQDKVIIERTSTNVWKHPFLGTDSGIISTDEMEGTDFSHKRWYNMGKSIYSRFDLLKIFLYLT